MSRVLYWNISKFALNKIANPRQPVQSQSRRQLVSDVLTQSNADIIIVGEVSARGIPEGQLLRGQGYAGCQRLLQLLQAADAAGDWRLVPPIGVGVGGKAEGVAVYYRGVTAAGGERIFTGPRRWSNAVPGSPLPAASAAPSGHYPAAQQADFGVNRQVPPAAQHNPNGQENQLAPGLDYYAGPFPHGFGGNRPPYCCTFCETNAAGAIARELTVFAVHTSPSVPGAVLAPLAASTAVQSPLGANETRVVLGDFNLNLLDPAGNNAQPYGAFTVQGFTVLLDLPAAPPVANLDSYKGYVATHIRRPFIPSGGGSRQLARFFSTAGSQQQYPSLRYIGADPRWQNFYSIDNILVLQAAAPPGGHNMTVANVCTGTPFTDPFGFNGGGPVVPLGPIAFARQMAVPPPVPYAPLPPPLNTYPWNGAPQNGIAPQFVTGANTTLVSFANYGRIYSTSDHFAVVADV
jgi:hypothetical protein